MFWGSISRFYGKGPCIFGEKNWGATTFTSYCQHVVPIIHDYTFRGKLLFMQDNASGHGSGATREEWDERVFTLFWPANSSDLKFN